MKRKFRTKRDIRIGIINLAKYLGKSWNDIKVEDIRKGSKELLTAFHIANLIEYGVIAKKKKEDGTRSSYYRWNCNEPFDTDKIVEIALKSREHKRNKKRIKISSAQNTVVVNQTTINEKEKSNLSVISTDEWITLLGFKSTKTHLFITIDKRIKNKSIDSIIKLFEEFE